MRTTTPGHRVAAGGGGGLACRIVDAHRGYAADHPEATGWYGDRGYLTGQEGEGRYRDERYGVADYGAPDPRRTDVNPVSPADTGRFTDTAARLTDTGGRLSDTGRMSRIGPRSGLPIPDDPLAGRSAGRPVSAPSSPAPTPGAPAAPPVPAVSGGGMYRSRRPAAAVVLALGAILLEIPALRLLWEAFTMPISARVVSAVCLVAALPLAATGLYAVATGAVRAAGPNSAQAWLRPPVAYLSVALVLLLAAGLAA